MLALRSRRYAMSIHTPFSVSGYFPEFVGRRCRLHESRSRIQLSERAEPLERQRVARWAWRSIIRIRFG